MQAKDDSDLSGMLVLVKGRDASGGAQYAYAAIAYERYDAFLGAQAAGAYDLSAFGTVLFHGSGAEPSAHIRTEMEEKYGAVHDFETQITNALDASAT